MRKRCELHVNRGSRSAQQSKNLYVFIYIFALNSTNFFSPLKILSLYPQASIFNSGLHDCQFHTEPPQEPLKAHQKHTEPHLSNSRTVSITFQSLLYQIPQPEHEVLESDIGGSRMSCSRTSSMTSQNYLYHIPETPPSYSRTPSIVFMIFLNHIPEPHHIPEPPRSHSGNFSVTFHNPLSCSRTSSITSQNLLYHTTEPPLSQSRTSCIMFKNFLYHTQEPPPSQSSTSRITFQNLLYHILEPSLSHSGTFVITSQNLRYHILKLSRSHFRTSSWHSVDWRVQQSPPPCSLIR